MKFLSWFGTAASILGSFTVASQFFLPGYCLFIAGSISWLAVSWTRRDASLMVLNGTFMVANFWGLYVAIA